MKRRAFLTSLMISLALFGIAFGAPTPAQAASLDCSDIAGLSGVYSSGAFLGIVGTFAPGDYVVFTVTLNTATMGSFSIIGDADLDPVLAGPTSIPGTLTYTVTGPLPAGAVGIGFYINSADGLVNVAASCADAPPSAPASPNEPVYKGPPIPKGFVLRTLICNVPVYDSPGGQVVEPNRIRAGQTWFVNPTTVNAADGTSWTEIFVSGVPNSFVPTRCVR